MAQIRKQVIAARLKFREIPLLIALRDAISEEKLIRLSAGPAGVDKNEESKSGSQRPNAIEPPPDGFEPQLVGHVWRIQFGREEGQYPKTGNLCVEWLAKLLAAPNRSLTVAELRGDPEDKLASDALPRREREADLQGGKAIRNRLEDIEEITQKTGGSETLESEKANLLRQLQASDANKHITNSLRKAHHNIATQIRALVREKLAKSMPKLAAHLNASLKLDSPVFGYYPPSGTATWKI